MKRYHHKCSKVILSLMIAVSGILSFHSWTKIHATSAEGMGKIAIEEEYNRDYMINVKEDGTVEHVKVEDLPPVDNDIDPHSSSTYDVVRMLDNGEVVEFGSYDTYEEAFVAYERENLARHAADGRNAILSNGQIRAIENGVVNMRGKITSCNAYVSYTEDGTGTSGYSNGCYGADAAYLGTNADGTKVKFKISGVVGWANASDVSIIDERNAYVSYYYVSNDGYLYHYIRTVATSNGPTSAIMVGYQPSYLAKGTVYFSYDGHYFYTDFTTMLNDYKRGVYTNAVNANDPYYNYYQYLSFRTKTEFSAADLDNRVANMVSGASAMRNTGADFINNQNTYGTNALLMYGVAANESGWGTSNYALNKNNLFGLNAYDSNPDDAYSFPSVGAAIKEFSKFHISEGYLDPKDMYGRFFGPHLGDKASGLNVKYASDPYWGEKAAAQGYYLEINTGKKYTGNITLGVVSDHTKLNVRKEPTSNSTKLYETANVSNFPVVILGQTTGPTVDGTNVWYKIQTDAPLTSDRNAIIQDNGVYNFDHNYAYVSGAYVTLITNKTVNPPVTGPSFVETRDKGGIIANKEGTLIGLIDIGDRIEASSNVVENQDGSKTFLSGGKVYKKNGSQVTLDPGTIVYDQEAIQLKQDAVVASPGAPAIYSATQLFFPKGCITKEPDGITLRFSKGALYVRGQNIERIPANTNVILGSLS
ncbi:MAG: glucosaminidase domain-containing protein [Erysipelotrichaceae bacterium]|nr:glucosaminidase domain-containing protein [Erysipelotrichaceae bacterium]